MVDFRNKLNYDTHEIELMGTWLRSVIDKVKEEARKTKGVQIITEEGKAQFGPSGISWTDTGRGSGLQTSSVAPEPTKTQLALKNFISNPLVFGTAVSLAFMMLKNRRKR